MKFTIPTVEVLKLAVKDVIATSPNGGANDQWGGTGGNED